MHRYALAVLTAMNLLNYLDRYVPSAVKDLFKADLGLTDVQTSLPLTAFVIVYMFASPVFGMLADRVSRPRLIAAGVALWSLATAAAALSTGFISFFICRAFVGIGEAAYATISPALLGDFYPPERRNRALTIFYVAIPVGAALGFTLGGTLGQAYGWRAAFLLCGAPGILAALLCLRIQDPRKTGSGTVSMSDSATWAQVLKRLRVNKTYVVAVAGYTLVTFAAGGMADWFPTFLSRHRGMSIAEAGSLVGTMTVAGGLLGTLAGGFLGDRLRTRQPYLLLSGGSMVLATLASAAALLVTTQPWIAVAIFFAQFFLWFYNGPINTLLVNSTDPDIRARAFSLSILSIHLFGDAISPPIIGVLSDQFTLPLAASIIPLAMALGSLVWLYGWRRC